MPEKPKAPIDLSAGIEPAQPIDLTAGLEPNLPASYGSAQRIEAALAAQKEAEQARVKASAPNRFFSNLAQAVLPSTTLSDYWRGPMFALKNPIEATKILGGAFLESHGEQLEEAKKSFRAASDAMHDPNLSALDKAYLVALYNTDLLMRGGAAATPAIGPAAVHVGEQIGSGDVAGGLGSGTGLLGSMWLGGRKPEPKPPTRPRIPTPEEMLLKHVGDRREGRKPITLTAGERLGPGFVQSTERVAAKTAIAQGKTADFLQNRQTQIETHIEDLVRPFLLDNEQPLSPSRLGAAVQEKAAATVRDLKHVRQATNEARARSLTNQGPISPAEAGSRIIDAINKANDTVLAREGTILQAVRQSADSAGIRVPYKNVSEQAAVAFERNQAAKAAGHPIYPSSLEQVLYKLSGLAERDRITEATFGAGTQYDALSQPMRNVVDQILAKSPHEHPFGAAADARTALLAETRRMERAGEVNHIAKGEIEQLTKTLTEDMQQALPPDLGQRWAAAREGYRAQRESVRANNLLRSVTSEAGQPKGEAVIANLLQRGNETDAAALMKIIEHDPATQAIVRRAAIDFIHGSAADSRTMLKLLDQRPGMKTILGPAYENFRRGLEAAALREASPQEAVYRAFLKRVSNMDEPEQIAARALKSPAYAERLRMLLRSNRSLGTQMGNDLFTQVLDAATSNGPFGTKGAYFDPVRFATEYQQSRPVLGKFIDNNILVQLDDFAEAMGKLTFSHDVPLGTTGTLQASYKSLGALETASQFLAKPLMIGAQALGTGAYAASHGYLYVGMVVALAGTLGPSAFVRFALSPTGSRVLALLGQAEVAGKVKKYTPAAAIGSVATQGLPQGEER